MKKIFLLLMAANGVLSATAQTRSAKWAADSLLPKWVIDVNVLGGVLTQDMTTINTRSNYSNVLSNAIPGNLKFTNGTSLGFDAQLGYFFGRKAHFGLGAGIMYLSQAGDATLDAFHVEYQSVDGAGNTFRQLVTATGPVKETLKITNVNIPLVLKYKYRFSRRIGVTADAGILYNAQIKNAYTTNASFNYEAIYKHVSVADGGIITVYDNSVVPASTDLAITQAQYLKTHPGGNVNDYFNYQRSLGYNVGLGVAPNSKTGNVSYTTGSVGFLFQPSLNYYFSDNVALNIGAYYLYQPFTNSAGSNSRLTDKVGGYSSVLNNVTASASQSYGGNIGVRFFLGKKEAPLVISSVESTDPTDCGMSDGSIILHGLLPGKLVVVTYKLNGTPMPSYTGMVEPNGTVKITGLASGAYTDIEAAVGRGVAATTPVTIVNPPLGISEYSTNPSAAASCDGTITISGLRSGQHVTVTYSFNGVAKPAFNGIAASNNTVVLSGLCAGTYSNIVAATPKCKANGTDITLVAPAPPAPVVPQGRGGGRGYDDGPLPDISKPILFKPGQTKLSESSYPLLEQAALDLEANEGSYIVIEGHADVTGNAKSNEILSRKRAVAVKKYLVEMGVNPQRLITIGRGSRVPAASNDTPEGRAQNRRGTMQLKREH